MSEILAVEGAIALIRDLRNQRIALAGLLAIVGGDSLDEAIERLDDVLDALPSPKSFPRGSKARELANTTLDLARTGRADLRSLREATL